MKIDNLLKKLLAQKKEVAEASKVSAQSIDFWEKRAEKLFAKMGRRGSGVGLLHRRVHRRHLL